jgi:hypothetical protein
MERHPSLVLVFEIHVEYGSLGYKYGYTTNDFGGLECDSRTLHPMSSDRFKVKK